jgi:ribosomal protein S18 acetylase RimI-like enzyme
VTDERLTAFSVAPLSDRHDRAAFSCGLDALDRYLPTQAGQDVRRRVASCFVLLGEDESGVVGYYTLSATSIALADLPPATAKRLPRYPSVPATLMGRLAVDRSCQGQRLGEFLLLDAINRCLRAEIASFAFVVDAIDDRACGFYERFGFRRFAPQELRLFMPMSEIAALFG